MPSPTRPLLVVTGEPSGDVAAARVVRELAQRTRAAGRTPSPVVAIGGDALAAAGAQLICHVGALSTMGTTEIASRGLALVTAAMRLRQVVVTERPCAALLVGFSEVNGRLYSMLRGRGVPSVFYGLPQVWAWRPRRAAHAIADVLCAMLPFEAPLWTAHGHDARFVGHPALEVSRLPRSLLRDSLGLSPRAPSIAILPGSRTHEIFRMLDPMLAAYREFRAAEPAIDARVFVAPSLDPKTKAHIERRAKESGVAVAVMPAAGNAGELLPAFDASLVTSGTATLEAALAGAHPVIVYRASRTTELAARALLSTPYIGLPNIVLGRASYIEVLGSDVTPTRLAHALGETLARGDTLTHASNALRAAFGDHTHPSQEVAAILEAMIERPLSVSAHPAAP